jgi:hypothetical protein
VGADLSMRMELLYKRAKPAYRQPYPRLPPGPSTCRHEPRSPGAERCLSVAGTPIYVLVPRSGVDRLSGSALEFEVLMDVDPQSLSAGAAIASAIAALASVVVAIVLTKNQTRAELGDALIRISETFESDQFRKHRVVIYKLDRLNYSTWSQDEQTAVDAWCAHLDLVASLIKGRQINKKLYLQIYGDVMFRTIFQIAPYCNAQLSVRGRQFLLPLRLVTNRLLRQWRREARRKRYPTTIGFPAQPHLRVNPDLFDEDEAVRKFTVKRRLKH